MTSSQALGQLRHLYKLLLDGKIKDQKEAAQGLVGPIIEALEKAERAENDRLQQLANDPNYHSGDV